MVSPTSGDDYYASLGKNAAQSGSGPEKKKIKIVAKKVVQPASSPEEQGPVVEKLAPTSEVTHEGPKEETPAYVPRVAKLPESGQLHLGTKFASRPSVVFHTHTSRSTLPNSPTQHRPQTAPGVNRPAFSARPGQPGSRPAFGGGGNNG